MHPKLLKWKNVDLTKIQNLAAVDQDIADAERDLEILKQGLPPKLRQQFDNISVDKKELDSLKQRVQAEKQRRAQPQQPHSAKVSPHINDGLFLIQFFN
ncbi:MAG: hypothetical protein RQ863_06945 [Sulfolobales archaeon]|nr:hypothetical protein [Sulfolobales archaeon]